MVNRKKKDRIDNLVNNAIKLINKEKLTHLSVTYLYKKLNPVTANRTFEKLAQTGIVESYEEKKGNYPKILKRL